MFKLLLGRCAFPKLHTLTLAFGSASQDELVSHFKGNWNIRVLALTCISLKPGLWKEAMECIRLHLPIGTIQIDQLYGGWNEPAPEDRFEWMDSYCEIEDHIFRNGPSPFSAREAARHWRDCMAKRPYIRSEVCINYEDFYEARSNCSTNYCRYPVNVL